MADRFLQDDFWLMSLPSTPLLLPPLFFGKVQLALAFRSPPPTSMFPNISVGDVDVGQLRRWQSHHEKLPRQYRKAHPPQTSRTTGSWKATSESQDPQYDTRPQLVVNPPHPTPFTSPTYPSFGKDGITVSKSHYASKREGFRVDEWMNMPQSI